MGAVADELEIQSWNLLEGLGKIMRKLSQESWYPCQDSNPSTGVPPYMQVIRSKTYHGYVIPWIIPNDLYEVLPKNLGNLNSVCTVHPHLLALPTPMPTISSVISTVLISNQQGKTNE
jgi:hypothetical protein